MYTNVNKCLQMFTWNLCNHWYEGFLKNKKNIIFRQSGACFFIWDSSGTAWHVNVFSRCSKTLGAWISLCSYLESPKSQFISATIFSIFEFSFFFLIFSNECNEFLKLRSDFSHISLAQTRYFFIVYKCALFLIRLSFCSKGVGLCPK